MNIFHKTTWETMKKNKTRTAVSVIGVILSTAMITAVTVFGFSIMDYLIRMTSETYGTWHGEASIVPYDQLKSIQGKKEILESGIIENIGYSKLEEQMESHKKYKFVAGFSKDAFELLSVDLAAGRLPNNSSEIMIPVHFMEYSTNKMKIGDTIVLELGKRYHNGAEYWQNDGNQGTTEEPEELVIDKTKTYTVVGIYQRGYAFEPYSSPGYTLITAAEENPEHSYQVYFKIENPKDIYQFSKEQLGDYKIFFNDELLRYLGVVDNDNFYTVIFSLGSILILLIIFGSVLLIYNAFSISVNERTKQFGLLSSIGASKKQIRKSIRFEAILVSALGIPIGILSGIVGIGITLLFIGKGIEKQLQSTTVQVSLDLKVSFISVILAAGIALITVMISSWIPSKKASKLSVMEALRQNDDIFVKAKEVKTKDFVYRVFHLEGTLASKNFKRNRKKYRTTIVSLAMSMVLFISTSSFIMYLQSSAGLVLEHPKGDIGYYSHEKEDYHIFELLKSESTVDSAYYVKYSYLSSLISKEKLELELADVFLDGKNVLSINLGIIPDEDFSDYAKKQGIDPMPYYHSEHLLGIAYDQTNVYNSETGKYSKTSLLRNHEPTEFSLIEVQDNDNNGYLEEAVNSKLYQKNLKIEVQEFAQEGPIGLDSIYGNEVILVIPEFQYLAYLKKYDISISSRMLFMTKQHEITYDNMNRMLLEQSGVGGILQDNAAIYEGDRNSVLALNVLSYGFISLISLISIANVFNTISTNLLLRKREFAMLVSVGMTRKGLKRMMNYECILYGVKAVLFGLPLSVLVTFGIYMSILQGVDLRFILPLGGMTAAIISVFLVVFATMLYSMKKIKNENTIDTLKKEIL